MNTEDLEQTENKELQQHVYKNQEPRSVRSLARLRKHPKHGTSGISEQQVEAQASRTCKPGKTWNTCGSIETCEHGEITKGMSASTSSARRSCGTFGGK